MAFVEISTWPAGALRSGAAARIAAPPGPAAQWLKRCERPLRRSGAIVFSAIVHGALLWLFVNRLGPAGEEEARPIGDAPRTFQLLSAAGGAPAAPQPAAAAPAAPAAPAAVETELDVTAPSPIPPPEWSVARIAAPPAPVPAAAAPAQAMAAPGKGAGNGGSEGWDPFAGAAPLRHPGPGTAAMPDIFRSAGIDLQALDELRRAVLREVHGAAGGARFRVRLSAEGMVTAAWLDGGDASAEAVALFIRLARGRRLAPASAIASEREVLLPEVRFS